MVLIKDEFPVSDSDCGDLPHEQDDEGWEDAQPDEEIISLTCLFGPTQFNNIHSLLQHCKDTHDFDLVSLKAKFGV